MNPFPDHLTDVLLQSDSPGIGSSSTPPMSPSPDHLTDALLQSDFPGTSSSSTPLSLTILQPPTPFSPLDRKQKYTFADGTVIKKSIKEILALPRKEQTAPRHPLILLRPRLSFLYFARTLTVNLSTHSKSYRPFRSWNSLMKSSNPNPETWWKEWPRKPLMESR